MHCVGDANCTDIVGAAVANNASAVILSTGKDRGKIASSIQTENNDLDLIYTKSTFSNVIGSEYDDVIQWVSPNILYSKMIEADQLP